MNACFGNINKMLANSYQQFFSKTQLHMQCKNIIGQISRITC